MLPWGPFKEKIDEAFSGLIVRPSSAAHHALGTHSGLSTHTFYLHHPPLPQKLQCDLPLLPLPTVLLPADINNRSPSREPCWYGTMPALRTNSRSLASNSSSSLRFNQFHAVKFSVAYPSIGHHHPTPFAYIPIRGNFTMYAFDVGDLRPI